MATAMELVCNAHAPVIISRKMQPSVVMVPLEDYQSMEETTYLLHSPENARTLLKSIAELEAGRGHEKKLIEWS
ncbi:type II toxin-antitoxin system prevent-host-death family antitoxin [Aliiglaciecola litoralis]|uniref:type II toxin-antitoxin system Phd/YefM family antitoxin n=1 Tax=Aliiglaciecola litoralis TaxID=582857 RepID=UPI0031D101C6